jgi:hypothetical protein
MSYAMNKSLTNSPNTPRMVMTGDKVPFLTNASMESAGVLGWAVNTAYGGDKADDEHQKKKAELMAKTISIVSALPILQVKTAAGALGDWSMYAFDQVKGQAISQIGKAPSGSSSGVYGEMDQQSRIALRDNTFNLMLRAGYLKPEHFEAANKAKGGATYQGVPSTALKGHPGQGGGWVADQPLQFDLASPEYQSWARNYGDNEWIQGNVYDPYNNQFPGRGGSQPLRDSGCFVRTEAGKSKVFEVVVWDRALDEGFTVWQVKNPKPNWTLFPADNPIGFAGTAYQSRLDGTKMGELRTGAVAVAIIGDWYIDLRIYRPGKGRDAV